MGKYPIAMTQDSESEHSLDVEANEDTSPNNLNRQDSLEVVKFLN
jgi:hypothetical protein